MRRIVVVAAALALMSAAAPPLMRAQTAAADPEAAVQAINKWFADQITAAREKNQPIDAAALTAERTAKAKAAVAGIDLKTVEPAKALPLAQLYQMAAMQKETREAAERFLTTATDPSQRYTAHTLILGVCRQQEDAPCIVKVHGEIKPPTPQMAVSFAATAARTDARIVADKMGLEAGLDLIKKAEAMVPFDRLTADRGNLADEREKQMAERDKQMAESAIVSLATGRSALLIKAGKKSEGLALLEEARGRLPKESRMLRSLEGQITQAKLPGSTAPQVKQERGYGGFKGLDSLRGKVVVLDFTAHW